MTDTEVIQPSDREELGELREEAEELLSGNNLTTEEREQVEEWLNKIDELLNRIDEIEEAEREAERIRLEEEARQREEEERFNNAVPTLSVVSETERWIPFDEAGLSATDDYGIVELAVSRDGGETWEALSSLDSTTMTVLENGTYLFRATNESGNTDTKTVVYHNIDSIAPVVAVDSHGYTLGSWMNQNVVLSASNVAENLSPVSLYVREQSNDAENEWQPYLSSVLVLEDTDSKVYEFKAVSAAGLESKVVSAEVRRDSVAPSGSISEGENTWNNFLNTLTFGLFFNETKEYTLSASDDRSGVDNVKYLVSSSVLDAEALQGATWLTTSGSVSVDPDATTFVYYRIEDRAGNIAVISLDGLVFELPGESSADVSFTARDDGYSTLISGSSELALINDLEHKTIEDEPSLTEAVETLEDFLAHNPDAESSVVSSVLEDYQNTLTEIHETEERIDVIESSNAAVPPIEEVTSDDKDAIQAILEAIDTVLSENGSHLTTPEREELESLADELNDKLARLDEVQDALSEVETAVDGYNLNTVNKDDENNLESLREDIESLQDNPNVSSSEQEQLEELLEKIDELEERIAEAEAALQAAKEQDAASGIDPSNVRPEDQTSLEDAYAAYAEALGVFDTNLSAADLFDLNNRLSIIGSALDILDQVAAFEAMVSRLPNPEDIDFSSRAALKAAQLAYQALSEYGRSLVAPSLMAKYKALIEAYRAYLEGSPLLYAFETLDVFWWGLTTFFIAGAFITITHHTHKRYAEEANDRF